MNLDWITLSSITRCSPFPPQFHPTALHHDHYTRSINTSNFDVLTIPHTISRINIPRPYILGSGSRGLGIGVLSVKPVQIARGGCPEGRGRDKGKDRIVLGITKRIDDDRYRGSIYHYLNIHYLYSPIPRRRWSYLNQRKLTTYLTH